MASDTFGQGVRVCIDHKCTTQMLYSFRIRGQYYPVSPQSPLTDLLWKVRHCDTVICTDGNEISHPCSNDIPCTYYFSPESFWDINQAMKKPPKCEKGATLNPAKGEPAEASNKASNGAPADPGETRARFLSGHVVTEWKARHDLIKQNPALYIQQTHAEARAKAKHAQALIDVYAAMRKSLRS